MSCNGCRVLRKGCSDSCVLRPCIQWIESPEAQGHATVFVAKFFGRAGLMSFISAVPEMQRPALFQSLLFEACGRTINPVNGAVGLLWTGRWNLCQAAVDTVLRGGALRAVPELAGAALGPAAEGMLYRAQQRPDAAVADTSSFQGKRRTVEGETAPACDLDLTLTPRSTDGRRKEKRRRAASPSMNSEGSVTTSAATRREMEQQQPRLLNLFA